MRTLIPGKSGWLGKKDKGLTLIELLVAVAIVGLIFAVSVTGLRSVFDVNLKKASGQLASTLRYLRNKAITDHLYLRVVFDLDGKAYRVEESSDPFVISPEEELAKGEEKEEEEKKSAEAKPVFTPSESRLLRPTKLPSGVFFKDVSVSYLPDKKEKGEVALYFFPDGYATPAVINLRDEDDEGHYSIEILSLSGRVAVAGEYREFEREEKK